MKRAIVIGLDGATFDLLLPLAEKGYLPNLRRMMEGGTWGALRTVIPPGTGPAWSSITTGLDPSNHGVFDFIVRAQNSYDLAFLNGRALRVPTVWDLVGRSGGKVLVLNVPMTYPPRAVNGWLVSGLLTPPGCSECTYPGELYGEILKISPHYKIVPTETAGPGKVDAFLDDVTRVLDAKIKVLKELIARADWTFIMQVFNETDFVQHALWHVIDPDHPRYRQSDFERYGERVFGIYSRIDQLLGEIKQAIGDDAIMMVVSDHGHGPLTDFLHANNLLLKLGMMKIKRSPFSRLKYLAFRMGLTPLRAFRIAEILGLSKRRMQLRWTTKGYNLLKSLFFSFSDIDWRRTRAYAISGGLYGGIFVNLEGREPEGAVKPDDYEATRSELRRMLLEVSHPSRKTCLVREVIGREEIYKGRFTHRAPDLYFLPESPTTAVFGDFEFSSNRICEPAAAAISAQHRMEGVFIAQGEGLKHGHKVEGMRVIDVAPLILYHLGLPIPSVLDGKLRSDIIEDDHLEANPPSYFDADDIYGESAELETVKDEEIKKRLKGLGYIS